MMKMNSGLRLLMGALAGLLSASGFAQKNDSIWKSVALQNVEVTGTDMRHVRNSSLNAIAVDVRRLHNTNLDIAGILNRISGVKVRQDGGVGSATTINLNGFTGKHVKIFLDGVPMDGSASSFNINNIPAGLARSIEVYKGVVPVEYGADALGGAINIVTDKSRRTFLDASYSYGSFNTHRTSVSAGLTEANGFTATINAYQNYSDNDYRVKTQNTDLQTMAISSDEQWFRRFHDRYHNEAVMVQAGFVDRVWADRLMLGLTYSREYADVQNANLMKIVFGAKHRRAEGWTPRLTYAKRNLFVRNLDLNLSAKYDVVTTNNVDTAARTYNWDGHFISKPTQGEGIATIAEYRGRTGVVVTGLKYRWGGHHFVSLNHTYSNYMRQTTDNAANAVQQTAATFMRRKNVKHIFGAQYKFMPNEHWNALLMLKHYDTHVRGPVNVSQVAGRNVYEEQERNSHALGYGLAGTYYINPDFQLKASFEKTFRLPNVRELFGDGDYEQGDAALRPEQSYNVNLNLLYERTFSPMHHLSLEVGLNNRNIRDYLIRTISPRGTAISTNHGKVTGFGLDLSARYIYRDALTLNASYALQDMRNRERYTSKGATSVTYGDRVPNLPYSFGNFDATYKFRGVLGARNTLSLSYGLQYVHRFFRSWRGEGAKIYIPKQLSHDLGAVLAIANGRYNIAVEANNITNELLYDNYSLQKPGRSFAIKFRYVFNKHFND